MSKALEKHGVRSERVLRIYGEINSELIMRTIEELEKFLREDSQAPIGLEINSRGGFIRDALTLADYVEENDVNLITFARGEAMSAGALILQLGKTRLANKNALINFHVVSVSMERQPLPEAKQILKQITKANNAAMEIYAKRTDKPLKKIKMDAKRDKEFTAEEAKEYGLVDEVI